MANFKITTPDGATYQVTAPDNASQADVLAYVQAQHAQAPAQNAHPAQVGPQDALTIPDKSTWQQANEGVSRFLGGAAKGFSSPIPSIAEISARGLDAAGLTNNAYRDTKAYFDKGLNDLYGPTGRLAPGTNGSTPGRYGEVAGQMLATAPVAEIAPVALGGFRGAKLLSAGLNSGLQGASAAALTSGSSDAPLGDQIRQGAEFGGLIGGGMRAAGSIASRVISPKVAPGAQALIGEGIPLTVGQTMGGIPKAVEDRISGIPFIGDVVKSAQARSTVGLNRAVLNRALAPVGETLPKNVPVGREGVDYVATRLGDKYDALLPQLSANAKEPQFIGDMKAIIADAQSRLPDQQYSQFQKIVNGQLSQKADPTGAFSGDALKGIESELSRLSSGLGSDSSFDNRELGGVVGDVQDALRSLVTRQNPAQADELAALNKGWANYARVRRASSGVGADNGVFTGPQLSAAVKASDRSVGKGNYARGKALMQDLSDPARSILPSKVPDSGTAGRVALEAMLLGGGTPFAPHITAPALIGGALYSKPGQALLRSILAKRPSWAPDLANTVVNNSNLLSNRAGILALPALAGQNYQ